MQLYSSTTVFLLTFAILFASNVDHGVMAQNENASRVERSNLPIISRKIGMQRMVTRDPIVESSIGDRIVERHEKVKDDDDLNGKRTIDMRDIRQRAHVRSFNSAHVEESIEKKRTVGPVVDLANQLVAMKLGEVNTVLGVANGILGHGDSVGVNYVGGEGGVVGVGGAGGASSSAAAASSSGGGASSSASAASSSSG